MESIPLDTYSKSEESQYVIQQNLNNIGEEDLQHQLLQELLNRNHDHFVILLTHQEVDPHYVYDQHYPNTCLDIACSNPDMREFVETLLDHTYPSERSTIISKSLEWAVFHGNYNAIDALLSVKNFSELYLDQKGKTLLHVICRNVSSAHINECKKCIKLLVANMKMSDINRINEEGYTAFDLLVGNHDDQILDSGNKQIANIDNETNDDCGHTNGILLRDEDKHKARSNIARLLLELTEGALDVDCFRSDGRCARNDVELRFPELLPFLPPPENERTDPHLALVQAMNSKRLGEFKALLRRIDDDGNPTLDPNHIFRNPLEATCLELAAMKTHGVAYVEALLDSGADPNLSNPYTEKCPVHVACEAGQHQVLKALFQQSSDADPNRQDRWGNTPLHSALGATDTNETEVHDESRGKDTAKIWKRITVKAHGRILCFEFLLRLEKVRCNQPNSDGLTPLMLALKKNNKEAIKIALSCKSKCWDLDNDLNTRTFYKSLLEHFPDLEDMINSRRNSSLEDYSIYQPRVQMKCEIPKSLSLLSKSLQRQQKLSKDYSMEISQELFQLLNPRRESEFIKVIKQYKNVDRFIDGKFTLLQRAARYGFLKAVEILLENNVDPNTTFIGNKSPPLVLATQFNHREVMKVILLSDSTEVNASDAKGNTALHYAAKKENNLPIVTLLLNHGADPYRTNLLGVHPLTKPQILELLNQCIETSDINSWNDDYELIFDYSIFADNSHYCSNKRNQEHAHLYAAQNTKTYNVCNNEEVVWLGKHLSNDLILPNETKLLYFMSRISDLSELLNHPVTYTYLQMKWSRIKYMTYCNFFIYVFYIICLNVFIISSKKYCTQNTHSNSEELIILAYISLWPTLVLWLIIAIREIGQLTNNIWRYFKRLDNYFDVLFLSLSAAVMEIPLYNRKICVDIDHNRLNTLHAITIMVSCVELLQVMGRIWLFAKHIEMLKLVLLSYLMPLLSYCVILIAFGLSFFTLFYDPTPINIAPASNASSEPTKHSDFDSWYLSIVKSVAMMTGELDLNSFPDRTATALIIFTVFVLVVTIVLLNLLVGLAVRDIQILENTTHKLRLITRVDLVYHNERAAMALYNAVFQRSWFRRWTRGSISRFFLRHILLFPDAASLRKARVRPNVHSKLIVGSKPNIKYYPLESSMLKEATSIVSERDKERSLTLKDIDTKLKRLLALKERCLLASKSEVGNGKVDKKIRVECECKV